MANFRIYQIIGYAIVFFLLLTSCELENELEGSGVVTKKRYAMQEFTDLNIDGVLNVYFTQSETYKLEVETDDNLHSIVKIENVGETLNVRTTAGEEFRATKLDVYLYAPSVNAIIINGVTALYFQNRLEQNSLTIEKHNTGFMSFKGILKYLTINTDGTGDMELEGKSENLFLVNNMVGDIRAFNFAVNYLDLSQGGTGAVEVRALNKIVVDIHGVGNVYCKGNPAEFGRTGNGIGHLYMVSDE